MDAIAKLIREQVLPMVTTMSKTAEAEVGVRQDQAIDDVISLVSNIGDQIDRMFSDGDIRSNVRQTASNISETSRRRLGRQMKRLTGQFAIAETPALRELTESFASNNVRLVKSIKQRHLNRVENILSNGLLGGRRASAIAADIRAATGISKRTARTIARDQTASLNGQLDRARQTANGVTKFRWQTVGDERVREEHEELDGQVFTWESGAPGGIFPGQPINCRCTAEPVF